LKTKKGKNNFLKNFLYTLTKKQQKFGENSKFNLEIPISKRNAKPVSQRSQFFGRE